MNREPGAAIPLSTLFSLLENNDFTLTVEAVINIEIALNQFPPAGSGMAKQLQYLVSPIVCRNSDDQQRIGKVFDEYTAILDSYRASKTAIADKWVIWLLKNKKNIFWISGIWACILLLGGYWVNSTPPISAHKPGLEIISSLRPGFQVRLGDSAKFYLKASDPNLLRANTISWSVNGAVVGKKQAFSYMFTAKNTYNIKAVETDSNGKKIDSALLGPIYCTTDNRLSVSGFGAIQFDQHVFLSFTGVLLISLLILVLGIVGFWLSFNSAVSKRTHPVLNLWEESQQTKQDDVVNGPYTISFEDQSTLVHPGNEIKRVVTLLHTRPNSGTERLDLKQTIYRTIRSGGFPVLSFSSNTRASEIISLIDSGNENKFLSKMHAFLDKSLHAEQVNLNSFYFYKLPFTLTNEQDSGITRLEDLKEANPLALLMIFSTAEAWFDEETENMNPYIRNLFGFWKAKVLISPLPRTEWGYKYRTLANMGFVILSLELEQDDAAKLAMILNSEMEESYEAINHL
jgi:hypothetical protein